MNIFNFENIRWQSILLGNISDVQDVFIEVKADVAKCIKTYHYDLFELNQFSFDGLGTFIKTKANHYHFKLLLEDFSLQAEEIYTLAIKYHMLSMSTAKTFIKECTRRNLITETDLIKAFYDIDSLNSRHGLIELACDYISADSSVEDELDELFPDLQNNYEHLFGLALGSYFLNLANSKYEVNGEIDLNLIGQGLNAYEYSHMSWAMYMGDAETSEKMSENARKRHTETYELKKQAIDYWCNNINPNITNEKAADILIKIVPLSHRKLSQYVSEAKKQKIHPASKA